METTRKTKRSEQSRKKDPNGSSGRVKIDPDLWSKLPAELLEREVLPFLRMPDLCRFRTVCRRWNNLICSSDFDTLCVENASKRANEGACLLVKRRVYSYQAYCWRELPGLSLFDLNEKRWYNLMHDFPKGHDDISAMDGGFVCAFVTSFTEEQRRAPNCILHPGTNEHQTLVMFNLFGGARKVLPNPPVVDVDLLCLRLKLIVENTPNTFRIFLLNLDCFWNRQSCLCIYESSTDQWRNAPDPPSSVDVCSYAARNAVFQGLLYVVFVSASDVVVLCSFNFLDNSWEDTGVQFPPDTEVCDLVVSDNRLFLIHQLSISLFRSGWPLHIREILPAAKECRTVVRMKISEVVRNFDDGEPRAFGFNKSILLMSEITGKVILYNLATGQWESLPQNPLEDPELLCSEKVGSRGTQMSYLRLPDFADSVHTLPE